MAKDRLGSDYSGNLSDATTCSCVNSSVDKCSLRSCGMFQEPFFLHPPGTRPRDGIYINPMTAYIGEPTKQKDTQSFYLHSPHDLVYTRITHLFGDTEQSRNCERVERKDETLTVKVDVHVNNGNYKPIGNGVAMRPDPTKDPDHAYEQICLHREETDSVTSSHKRLSDNISDSSRSRKADRRYSRSSSVSESSNISSEIQCYSSTTSTPSLSRNSSSEHIDKGPKIPEAVPERKDSVSTRGESEKDAKVVTNDNTGPGLVKPPPPPPPPPPDSEDIVVVVVNAKHSDNDARDERKEGGDTAQDGTSDSCSVTSRKSRDSAANKSDASSAEQPEVVPASSPVEIEEIKPHQVSHLVNKHMVLPFIPPKFTNAADSNTLLKPSEYLKSICKNSSGKNSLSKARSVDNLDIQSRAKEEEAEAAEGEQQLQQKDEKETSAGPPPPPLPPQPKKSPESAREAPATPEVESLRSPQPLATISIQDLTSVQLRRTNTKMHATKTFSAPPNRSVSMTNVSEPFFVQKTDLIAELKKTKDIPGIKKLKVERAQVEKSQEESLMSEISKAFSVSNFVDQIPEKDNSGNVIPIWKRQMLARKAAERAKKELEEQIARENEERRQRAIPPWKRQLLAKKDSDDKKQNHAPLNSTPAIAPSVKIEISPAPKREVEASEEKTETENQEKRNDAKYDSDDGQIIPWRAQLRKTKSKLDIAD